MGYYVECSVNKGKAQELVSKCNAKVVTAGAAKLMVDNPLIGVVCVVDNGPFEAAAYCYSQREYDAFNEPTDRRPKMWLAMDRSELKRLTGCDK